MKRIWIDYNHVDGVQTYETEAKALEVITDILSGDVDLLNGRSMADFSINDIFDIGHQWYGITMEEVKPTPCCPDKDMEYDDDGKTDGVTFETWKCKNCWNVYIVPIEIVRDFDNMEECN